MLASHFLFPLLSIINPENGPPSRVKRDLAINPSVEIGTFLIPSGYQIPTGFQIPSGFQLIRTNESPTPATDNSLTDALFKMLEDELVDWYQKEAKKFKYGPQGPIYPARQSETMNILLDSILMVGSTQIASKMPVPDVIANVSKQMPFFRLNAKFAATKGYLTDLKTLRRVGNAVLQRGTDTWTLQLELGFQKLLVFFKAYYMKVLGIHMSGSLTGIVHGNSFLFRVGLRVTDTDCSLFLDQFSLTRFENIDINMTGADRISDWLRSRIFTYVVNHFNGHIKHKLERNVSATLEILFKSHEADFCGLIHKIH